MDYYAHPSLEKIMKSKDNNACNDCGTTHPIWASINNGILLCLNCAGVHRGFGVQVSIIRSLTMDNWDDNQIKFLLLGGNKRFSELMSEFNVPKNAGPEFKYLIAATSYYRKLLRSEVTNETPPEKPDNINGLELLDLGTNNYTNITNVAPITNQTVIKNEFQSKQKKEGFFGKIGGFFGSVKETFSEKLKDSKIGDKLKETGGKALEVAKKTGNFVVEKGKEAYQSKFVQKIAHKTEEGINTLVVKAKKVFENEESGRGAHTNYRTEELPRTNKIGSDTNDSLVVNFSSEKRQDNTECKEIK